MKLFNVKNINGFFEIVKSCKGDITLTANNQVFNLKDNINTYTNLFTALAPASGIPEINIETKNSEDMRKLLTFAIRG